MSDKAETSSGFEFNWEDYQCHVESAIEAVDAAERKLAGAHGLYETTNAVDALANAVNDLRTWHRGYNYETGEIEEL